MNSVSGGGGGGAADKEFINAQERSARTKIGIRLMKVVRSETAKHFMDEVIVWHEERREGSELLLFFRGFHKRNPKQFAVSGRTESQ